MPETNSSILDNQEQLQIITRSIEERWLSEFTRQQDEMDSRYANQEEFYAQQSQMIRTIVGYVSEYQQSIPASARLLITDSMTPEILDAVRDFVQKGIHFDFLLKEIKRHSLATDLWEQLMMVLKLSEDDNTPNISS